VGKALQSVGTLLKFVFLSFLFSLLTASGNAQCINEDIIPGQYIVRLKKALINSSSVLPLELLSKKTSHDFQRHMLSRKLNYKHLFREVSELSPPTTFIVKAENINDVAFLAAHPSIETLEPDCHVHLMQTPPPPNDPQYSKQWGLEQIHIRDAWTITKGSPSIIVSVSDTGVDYNHEDLKANMWTNPKEIAGNGIDDDGNGCVDDIHGCDLADLDGDPMPLASNSALNHGTHVAGIIAARSNNNLGGSGVAPNVKLMAAKGFPDDPNKPADESALLQSVYYSVNNGARVINCSWGRAGTPTTAELDAFKYAADHNVVVVVAAGNNNQDTATFSPAAVPGVIAVAATDTADQIASFSNWGSRVDLAAPGGKGFDSTGNMLDAILSTIPTANGKYGNMMGTSMAAPFVAGLAALVLSVNPNFTTTDVLRIMQQGGDKIHVTTSGGQGFDYSRINAFGALRIATSTVPGTYPAPSSTGNNISSSVVEPLRAPASLENAFKNGGGCGLVSAERKVTVDMWTIMFETFFLTLPLIFTFILRYFLICQKI
jgi:hypothetical protein